MMYKKAVGRAKRGFEESGRNEFDDLIRSPEMVDSGEEVGFDTGKEKEE